MSDPGSVAAPNPSPHYSQRMMLAQCVISRGVMSSTAYQTFGPRTSSEPSADNPSYQFANVPGRLATNRSRRSGFQSDQRLLERDCFAEDGRTVGSASASSDASD
jgi:hypothetical protein